jgi:hypothetical protein
MKRSPSGLLHAVIRCVAAGAISAVAVPQVHAQETAPFTISVTPASLEMAAGESAKIETEVRNSSGDAVDAEVRLFSRSEGAVDVSEDGSVDAKAGGSYRILVFARAPDGSVLRSEVPVEVAWPPITAIEVTEFPDRFHAGNIYRVRTEVRVDGDLVRDDIAPALRSSDPSVLSIGAAGGVQALAPGKARLTATADGFVRSWDVEVLENPVRSVRVTAPRTTVRTGDVVRIEASPLDGSGRVLSGMPMNFSVESFPIDTLLAPPAAALVSRDGRFVAEKPGAYRVHATSGASTGSIEIRAEGREVAEMVELLGHGAVSQVHTSDLWVWEGVDGRDYAVTGTWGGEGKAYFWDVTDPTAIAKIDSFQVDARTVNDVKVSEDGRVAVISREGASNRRNGIVILDVSDPRDVREISRYDEGLTGGVHNVFIHDGHVFALSAGRRYDILDIRDPANPTKVGSFELDTPGHAIHDVWVEDGIAYSSNWSDGVVMVDVGNGVAGGSVANPVMIGSYAYPSGANHAAFPFRSRSTGKFYVIAGDEIMPECSDPDRPCITQGYLHFIDFTDPKNPQEVARYQVPEAGTHNMWVEGDRLYVAYYNGGLRVVDISGELMGDLYRQGREIAVYRAWAENGFVANTPMTWGPQPHKGNLFFSEFNSGLWAVRLEPVRELVP